MASCDPCDRSTPMECANFSGRALDGVAECTHASAPPPKRSRPFEFFLVKALPGLCSSARRRRCRATIAVRCRCSSEGFSRFDRRAKPSPPSVELATLLATIRPVNDRRTTTG